MSPALVVALCGVTAALVAFAMSASRTLHIDPVDPAASEQAVRRSLWRHPRIQRFLRERMDRKLLTKRGRALYRRRSQIIEPVFGQTKSCRGIDRFMQRGQSSCQSEWKLICGTHNLLKLWRSGKANWN